MVNIVFDIETTGLFDNLFERIICICTHNIETGELKSFVGDDEKKILDEFFTYLSSLEDPILFGYNSESFDLPFIVRRAVVYKKRIPKFRSVDLRKKVNGFSYSYNNRMKGTLHDWAGVLNIPVTTIPGSEMFKLYRDKNFDEIKNHCLEDIKITTKLYEHAAECGIINLNVWSRQQ